MTYYVYSEFGMPLHECGSREEAIEVCLKKRGFVTDRHGEIVFDADAPSQPDEPDDDIQDNFQSDDDF